MSRRIFVGDIHGCLDAFDRLLAAADHRPGTDRVIAVGDLVNKGPDSLGVLRRMIELDAAAVLGNHDYEWLAEGRIADPTLAAWLRARPLTLVFDDVIVVHAGLHPQWDEARLGRLEGDDVDFALNVRYCTATGERPPSDWPPPGEPYRPWYTFWSGPKRVVYGHWARAGLTVSAHATGLDSACVYGGALTAWIPEEDRFVQVPATG